MSNRRKTRPGGRRALVQAGHGGAGHLDCGCSGWGVMHAYGRCDSCGRSDEQTFPPIPTSGDVGDTRQVAWSCPCGGEITGYAEIVSVTG